MKIWSKEAYVFERFRGILGASDDGRQFDINTDGPDTLFFKKK